MPNLGPVLGPRKEGKSDAGTLLLGVAGLLIHLLCGGGIRLLGIERGRGVEARVSWSGSFEWISKASVLEAPAEAGRARREAVPQVNARGGPAVTR